MVKFRKFNLLLLLLLLLLLYPWVAYNVLILTRQHCNMNTAVLLPDVLEMR